MVGIQCNQANGSAMKQIGTSTVTAIVGSATHAQFGARAALTTCGNEASTTSSHNLQSIVSEAGASATSAPLSCGRPRVKAALNLEHPLMEPHPTD